MRFAFIVALLLAPLLAQAQPTGGRAPQSVSVTELGDVDSVSGDSGVLATVEGSLPTGNCAEFDADGNVIDSGAGCGGGGGSYQYYNQNFTWPSGTATSSPLTTLTITHNVGVHPDLIVVYYKDPTNGWFQHYPIWRTPAGLTFGWNAIEHTGSDVNIVDLQIWTNDSGASGDALARLFWFTSDDLDTATNGLGSF